MGEREPEATAAGWVRRHGREALAAAALLIAARAIATIVAQKCGFHTLSDDDFARITIAQAFARAPRLDPSATSWLPLPFWSEGAAMMLLGRSLVVAQAFAATMSAASCVVLYAASRVAGVQPRAAIAGSLICTLTPVALLVGAAPVPDFGVAVLCASALILLRANDPRWRIASGVLVLMATLCRYEPWPAAIAIAVMAWTFRAAEGCPKPSVHTRWVACALALAGPCLWIAWNAHAHGDPLHFHARVSAYRTALGAGSSGLRALLSGYPSALAADAPALLVVVLLGWSGWRLPKGARCSWSRPLVGALVVLAALVLADAAGSAPTHHPERALLAVWFVGWIAASDHLDRALSVRKRGRLAIMVAAGLAVLAFGVYRMSSIFTGYGVDRQDEVRVGAWLSANTGADDRVLVDPVDYGYFAIMAASGAPERVVLSRGLDPRAAKMPSPFESASALRARVEQDRVTWLVASERASLREVAEVRVTLMKWEVGRRN
ncbi:MAG: hypothetical protein HY898_28120 [Deltaproteobacteria bacterium]|nr:hypothetical protein [Deltaproteobacteria bacterium]